MAHTDGIIIGNSHVGTTRYEMESSKIPAAFDHFNIHVNNSILLPSNTWPFTNNKDIYISEILIFKNIPNFIPNVL